ncbi:MAG: DUF3500 domain-containing protein [Cyclobacteriaceae bacterium]
MKLKNKTLLLLMVMVFITKGILAQDLAPLAIDFVNSLDSQLKKQACFPFDHTERFNWHFVPRERKGPTFHDFNANQKNAALALMKASLGPEGHEKAQAIFDLESVLKVVEKRKPEDNYRDPLNYHFSIFGQPGSEKEWGWRLEGHHLSLNFSSSRGTIISSTPSFMGSNPGIVLSGPQKGRQVLAEETNLGFELVQSLNAEQKQKAKFSDEAPADIITANDRTAQYLKPEGISFSELNKDQQALLKKLVKVYLSRYTEEYQKVMIKRIDAAGWEDFTFAWAGSEINEVGQAHYYRLQGADLLIEYDNIQNNANHVHAVFRDMKMDFGGDLLKSHYQEDHHKIDSHHTEE